MSGVTWKRAVLAGAMGVGMSGAMGLAQIPADRPVASPVAAERPPGYATTKRIPDDLAQDRARRAVILPSKPLEGGELADERSTTLVGRVRPETHRLPEGYVLGAVPARVGTEGQWLMARLEPRPDFPEVQPLRLLPNRQLALIESILAEAGETPRFLLTGRVTEFQGASYMLVEDVAQLLAPPPAPAPEPVTAPAPAPPPLPEPTGSSAEPALPPGDGREPTAEDIIKELMASEPVRAVVLPDLQTVQEPPATQPEQPATPAADAAPGAPHTSWPESTLLIDHLGRVVSAGDGGWALAFEDRGQEAARKPVRLLPSRLLESALAISAGGSRGVVFSVSGEITSYKGQHYLLLRKILVRRDLGNLR